MNSALDWRNEQPLLPGLTNPRRLCCSAFAAGLALDPERPVSQWADEEPGPRKTTARRAAGGGGGRTDRPPYLREIMAVLSPTDPTQSVVLQKPTQIGGTECGNNW